MWVCLVIVLYKNRIKNKLFKNKKLIKFIQNFIHIKNKLIKSTEGLNKGITKVLHLSTVLLIIIMFI